VFNFASPYTIGKQWSEEGYDKIHINWGLINKEVPFKVWLKWALKRCWITLRHQGFFALFRRSINYLLRPPAHKESHLLGLLESENPSCDNTQLLILTHVWNLTGVPILSAQMASELKSQGVNVALGVTSQPKNESPRLIGDIPLIVVTDFFNLYSNKFRGIAILNTTCIPEKIVLSFLQGLQTGLLRCLIIYSHENVSVFSNKVNKKIIELKKLNAKLFLLAGSKLTADFFQSTLPSLQIESFPYYIKDLDQAPIMHIEDFNSIKINITGSFNDNRKRQVYAACVVSLAIFLGWLRFVSHRKITITFIGDAKTKISKIKIRVIRIILGRKVFFVDSISHDKYVSMLGQFNTVMCVSQYETLPLFVSECMRSGALVLRNLSGGFHEQVVEGINGFLLSDSLLKDACTLRRLADRNCFPNETLLTMSHASRNIFKRVHSNPWTNLPGLQNLD